MRKQKNIFASYKESWNFIKESKNYIYLGVLVFLISALIGYFAKIPLDAEQKILEMLKQLIGKFEGLNVYQTIWLILSNNVLASFLALFLGLFFGVFPILTSLSNGFLLGYVANRAVAEGGMIILWKLFPHGIFELPAVLISIGIGIRLGFNLLNKKNRGKNIFAALKTFFLIVVPLLIIAAIIEGLLVFLVR